MVTPRPAPPRFSRRSPASGRLGGRAALLSALAAAATTTPAAAAPPPPIAATPPAPGAAAGWQLAPLQWPLPASALPGRALRAGPPGPRHAACDFERRATSLHPLPSAQDPVWRRVSAAQAAALRAAAEAAAAGRGEAALAALLGGPLGPTLARLGMSLPDVAARRAVVALALPLAERYPRLASAALEDLEAADPALAIAAHRLVFAAGCDATLVFGAAALRHPAAEVRRSAIDAAVQAAARWSDHGLGAALAARVAAKAEPDPALRLRALRGLMALGANELTAAAAVAARDPDPRVRAEAVVAAVAASGHDTPATAKLLRSRAAWDRACAVRALLLLASDPALRAVAGVRGDSGEATDPVSGERLRVGALAEAGLRTLGETPPPPRDAR
jgi:hypothetical protein